MPAQSENVVGSSREGTVFPPFAVEIDHPRNSDILLQAIPGERLRSAIDGSRPVENARTGELRVPLDQARHLAAFPKTPGMRIRVVPANCTYTISDPLQGNEVLCDRIRRWMRDNGHRVEKLDGVPEKKGTLDVHRFKTLCRELLWLVQAGEAKRVEGVVPDLEEISQLPGHFLLNPGSRVSNTQPVYEKDFGDWVSRLSHSGG